MYPTCHLNDALHFKEFIISAVGISMDIAFVGSQKIQWPLFAPVR
jgi:hypothetical protein